VSKDLGIKREPPQDQTTVTLVNDPTDPTHQRQIPIVVNKGNATGRAVTVGGMPVDKATASDQKDASAFKDASHSLSAIKELAAQDTAAADKGIIDQYFNIIRPSTGGRMSDSNINWLKTPGDVQDKVRVYMQLLDKGQPLTKNYRQEIINAAAAVVHSKDPNSNPSVSTGKKTISFKDLPK
jgi:hypothetical protein